MCSSRDAQVVAPALHEKPGKQSPCSQHPALRRRAWYPRAHGCRSQRQRKQPVPSDGEHWARHSARWDPEPSRGSRQHQGRCWQSSVQARTLGFKLETCTLPGGMLRGHERRFAPGFNECGGTMVSAGEKQRVQAVAI